MAPPSGPGPPGPDARVRALLRELAAEGLTVPGPGCVGDRITRARQYLVTGLDDLSPNLLLSAGLAALALGWPAGARRLLERLAAEPDEAPAFALPLLAGSYALWTGDVRTVSALSPTLAARLPPARDAPWADPVLAQLVRAVEPGGKSPRLQDLRRAGGVEPRGPGDPLPWPILVRLLSGDATGAPAPSPLHHLTDPEGLGELLAGAPREGTEAPPAAGDPDDRPAPLLLLPVALVWGTLGAGADACYGRLRLAPRVPAAWDAFRVRNLRMGDGAATLDYRHETGRHTFSLEQTRGRVPINLVFEPLVPTGGGADRVSGVPAVRVDGEPARPAVRQEGPRTRIRLQLPLDRRREIQVGGEKG